MKVFNLTWAVLFALGAIVQYNDPDPLLWIAFYAAAALVSGFAAFDRYYVPAILVVMLAYLGAAVFAAPGFFDYLFNQEGYTIMNAMSNDQPYIEESREFLGLCILLALMGFQLYRARKRKRAA